MAASDSKKERRMRRGYSVSGIVYLVVLAAFLSLGVLLGKGCASSSATSIDTTVLKNAILGSKDLVTTYNIYSGIGKFEDNHKIQSWDVPFTSKHLLYTFQGKVLLGLDGDQISVNIKDGSIIEVSCPPISILSNEIDPASIEVYDESTNIFNPIRAEDVYSSLIEQKTEYEKKMMTNGVLESARDNAEKAIRELVTLALQALPEENRSAYTIEVTIAPNETLTYLDGLDHADSSQSSLSQNESTQETSNSIQTETDNSTPSSADSVLSKSVSE